MNTNTSYLRRLLISRRIITVLACATTLGIATSTLQAANAKPIAGTSIEQVDKQQKKNRVDNTLAICDALFSGKITPAEAAAKLSAPRQKEITKEQVIERLDNAVQSGKLTQQEADDRLDSFTARKTKDKKEGDAKGSARLEQLNVKLQAQVKDGSITEAEAKERYEEATKRVKDRSGNEKASMQDRAKQHLTKVGTDIKASIANGDITEEEGKKQYMEAIANLKKRMRSMDQRGSEKGDIDGFKRRIDDAVKSGKMTQEEASEALQRFKQREKDSDGKRTGRRNIPKG